MNETNEPRDLTALAKRTAILNQGADALRMAMEQNSVKKEEGHFESIDDFVLAPHSFVGAKGLCSPEVARKLGMPVVPGEPGPIKFEIMGKTKAEPVAGHCEAPTRERRRGRR